MEKLRHKPESLIILFSAGTGLTQGACAEGHAIFTNKGSVFEICPSVEQTTPNFLKLRNKEDKLDFYLSLPEEEFPCPVRNAKPGSQEPKSLYNAMVPLLREWEKGNSHPRIIASIVTIFGRVGVIANRGFQESFFAETNGS